MPKGREGRYDVLAETKARKGLATGHDDGRVRRFLEAVWVKEKLSLAEGHAIMNVCMAASYDPDPAAPLGFRLPFNLETGGDARRALEALARERSDPPRRPLPREPAFAQGHLRRLRVARPVSHPLRGQDPLGATALAGIRHTYEEFDDNHSDIDYRMNVSLPFLYRALKP